ncbi:MAG TPA: DUF2721 domain-containing protein [Usitatibacter sp.]|jgi:ABC-type glycerol-3-phosphate transport system permease component|nr:DUF2721 domain-containing protein [Usitatibacter sp.]
MVPSDTDVTQIVHAIQLSVAPVFLLTGIAALLGVMATRLARVIDRARHLEGAWKLLDAREREDARAELHVLSERARLSSWSINACAMAALLVCLVIATLFIDAYAGTRLRGSVAALFILSMAALIGGVMCFLREVYLATHSLRIGPPPGPTGPSERP